MKFPGVPAVIGEGKFATSRLAAVPDTANVPLLFFMFPTQFPEVPVARTVKTYEFGVVPAGGVSVRVEDSESADEVPVPELGENWTVVPEGSPEATLRLTVQVPLPLKLTETGKAAELPATTPAGDCGPILGVPKLVESVKVVCACAWVPAAVR